jgi:protein-disulfide isomerase/uncharacterized membrane protein
MRPSPTRHRVALLLALLGLALSVVTVVVHQRLAAGEGYTSFCNLGSVVNCDRVLTSRFATLFGVSVATWGAAAFAIGALLALPGALGDTAPGLRDLALLGLVSGSVGFAFVLAGAMWMLGNVCLLCLSLDTTIAAWFLTVAPLATRFETSPRQGWWHGRTAARAAAAAGVLLAVAGGTYAAMRAPASATTLAEVMAEDPRFYAWYTKLPVLPPGDLSGPSPHVKGAKEATVRIVEFADFQCPACSQAFQDLRDLVRRRHDVSVTFRHFPLDASCNPQVQHTGHPDACLAAVAAECASQQGQFWEYHDVLFENHDHLDRASLFRYAHDLGLDIPEFRTCLDDPATRDRVVADVDVGARVGVKSTPTIFINGRQIAGALERTHYDYALIIERSQRTRAPAGAS